MVSRFLESLPRNALKVLIISALTGAAACGGGRSESPGAEAAAAPGQASGPNLERGRLLALACAACHTFGAGERHAIGPNLNGVFGRPAGAAAGFQYSAALEAADIVWTPEELDRWLADPTGFVPGTTMAFTGYQRPEDRRDLIAWLVSATAP